MSDGQDDSSDWIQRDQQLAAQPLVEMVGVVRGKGAGCVRLNATAWLMLTGFDAWRIGSGTIQERPLRVFQILPDDFDRTCEAIAAFRAYAVVRIEAQLHDDPDGTTEARVERVLGNADDDTALVEAAERASAVPELNDEVFGSFLFDPRMDQYETEVDWNGREVSLSVDGSNFDEAKAALATAHELWRNQLAWKGRVDDFAVQQLLPLRNQSWLDAGESETTVDEFKNRMALSSVSVQSDGHFTFWHDDGDLFCGHSIQICGNLTDGPTSADIPG